MSLKFTDTYFEIKKYKEYFYFFFIRVFSPEFLPRKWGVVRRLIFRSIEKICCLEWCISVNFSTLEAPFGKRVNPNIE